jgi:hypothetical protein
MNLFGIVFRFEAPFMLDKSILAKVEDTPKSAKESDIFMLKRKWGPQRCWNTQGQTMNLLLYSRTSMPRGKYD